MGRPSDFSDPEYDRRLEEFKARKKARAAQEPQSDSRQSRPNRN